MSDPVVFISHFRIKQDKVEALERLSIETTDRLRSEKPRTALFLSYTDEDQVVISFLHAFADADALDAHFEGAAERARIALEFLEPVGWEFYGKPSGAALESVRQAATASGATFKVEPKYVAGFLRLSSG
jgi:quinol monooxygenase YgiN